MTDLEYHLGLLEEFRVAATKASGRVGTIGDDVAGRHVPATAFGTTPGGAALAATVHELLADTRRQFARGEELLRSVGRAIDGVMDAIEDAERTGRQRFTAGTAHTGGGYTAPASVQASGGGGGDAALHPSGVTAPPVDPGTGVTVNLPGKLGTVEAPNARAAGAVRAALRQLGVPYVFGANSPSSGFDCSGLTQWAYGKEGVELDHFAASQDVGARVSRENLAPGDLVVWDGHVAMYIGDGKVVEAPQTGDVVHVVPLYTHNGGDRFEGFFRPTVRG